MSSLQKNIIFLFSVINSHLSIKLYLVQTLTFLMRNSFRNQDLFNTMSLLLKKMSRRVTHIISS
jgi:hypothetical protein